LLAICLVGKNVEVVVVLTILAVMFYGSMFSGVFSNQSDLAPNFAGTLMAVTNMLATIPGNTVFSVMVKSTNVQDSWYHLWLVS
jgi:ACS family sodium-dependent inorganic phosphate cotransporter